MREFQCQGKAVLGAERLVAAHCPRRFSVARAATEFRKLHPVCCRSGSVAANNSNEIKSRFRTRNNPAGKSKRRETLQARAAGQESVTACQPLGDVMAGVTLLSLDGSEVPITSLWEKQRAVVAWARHFGCLLCKKRAALLAAQKAELDRLNVTLTIIAPGSLEQAQAFAERTGFPGAVFADPSAQSYRALGFVFGPSTVFTPTAAVKLIEARMEGYTQDWELSLQRDTVMEGGWQQGGVMVAGPGIDNLIFLHKDKEAGDEPDMNDVMAAVRK